MSASCSGIKYPHQNNPMLNAVHCADKLIGDFIDDIQQQGLAENTLIVLASDHLAIKNMAYNDLKKGERRNLLLMIPPGLEKPKYVNKAATILDAGVTTLALMGFDIDQLGFGRNILAQEPTLLGATQPVNLKDFNKQLESSKAELSSLWAYPELTHGMTFNLDTKEVMLGQVAYKYPLLLLVDESDNISDVSFDFNSVQKNAEILQGRGIGQKYIWVDDCYKLSSFQGGAMINSEHCIAVGQLGANIPKIDIVGQELDYLDGKKIKEWLGATKLNDEYYQVQKERLKSLAKYGLLVKGSIRVSESFPYQGFLAVSAAGEYQGSTTFKTLMRNKLQSSRPLSKGITLLSLEVDKPRVLLEFDACGDELDIIDNARLVDKIKNSDAKYFVLLSHKRLHCGRSERLDVFFAGSGLKQWNDISIDQGYIALLDSNGQVQEFLGHPDELLGVAFLRQKASK